MSENKMKTHFLSIDSAQDIEHFLNQTNGLHDGYIVSVQYEHSGHTVGNPHIINPEFSELKIRFLVTSICNTIVEIVFQNILEWQVKDDQSDMTDTSVSFTDNGFIIWADDSSNAPDIRIGGSYVIAKSMKWRIL